MKLWDEGKWNIHSSSYNSTKYSSAFSEDRKEDKKYHEQKYGSKEKSASSDYMRKHEEKDEKEKNPSHFDVAIEEKNEKKQDLEEESVPFKAAKELFNESGYETKKSEKKKEINSIEEAIKKAIEGEKEVIVMDN